MLGSGLHDVLHRQRGSNLDSSKTEKGALSPLQAGYLYLTDPQRLHHLMTHLGLGAKVPPDGEGQKILQM